MRASLLFVFGSFVYVNQSKGKNKVNYKANWQSLNTRPLPAWYDKAKIGIFLHWGVYSVPSIGWTHTKSRDAEWFWYRWTREMNAEPVNYMKKNYRPEFAYQDFAPMFTAELFNPDQWADLFTRAGAKYVVLTAKHHDGFTLFPSNRSFKWNSVEVGPKRDLVGDLATAVRKKNLTFGVYYSLMEWFNPVYTKNKKNQSNKYVTKKMLPEIKQLVLDYKPSVIWSDGDVYNNPAYWNSTHILAWLYNDSPVKEYVVVNDRWGAGTSKKVGDFYSGSDRWNPMKIINHKWENAFTIDIESWGYRRNMVPKDLLTIEQILFQVIVSVSCGGNVLINVGPTKDGTIAPIFQERLLALGEWLAINGEGIYSTSPWLHQKDSKNGDVWYTCTKTHYNAVQPTAVPSEADTVTAIYAIMLKWPKGNLLKLSDVSSVITPSCQVKLLGNEEKLHWTTENEEIYIQLPDKSDTTSQHAWTLKFTLQ